MDEQIKKYVEENKPCLYILTPCYGSVCCTHYTTALIQTMQLCKRHGIEVFVDFCNNDSLVPRARNNMIAKAMTNDEMTHVLFIDADIIWTPSDVLKLLLDNKMIVGGLYPLKKYNWKSLQEGCIEKIMEKKQHHFFDKNTSDETLIQNCLLTYNYNHNAESQELHVENSVAKVRHIATGFMMIKRDVIKSMRLAYPSTQYQDDSGYLKGKEHEESYALFDCAVEDGRYYSEDWLFCERWKKMGGNIYVNISVNLSHFGTAIYQGSFLNSVL